MELKKNEFIVTVNLDKLSAILNIEKGQSLLHAQFLNDVLSAGSLNLGQKRHAEWLKIRDELKTKPEQ